jgi:aspartate-semialdehyde dehydrogenase
MASDLRVGVAGATGALGSEIVKVLDEVAWRPASLVPLARSTTSTTHVDFGGDRVPVDDFKDESLGGLDLLFVALPREAARVAGEAAIRAGIPVVDCSGAFALDRDVPLVVPWVNPDALAGLRLGAVAVPDPAAVLVASVLGPLRRAGVEPRVDATVLVPASREGRPGIDELSRQVVALFNSGTPPRKVFPQGLAFDLTPAVGAVRDDGWTEAEREVAAQVDKIVGPAQIDVSLVGVPVFSGLSALLVLRPDKIVPPELVMRVLADGGVRLPDEAGPRFLPRPRRVEGKPFAHVGRVRLGRDGRSLHLWLSMDNLRTVATVAVANAGVLLRVASGSAIVQDETAS